MQRKSQPVFIAEDGATFLEQEECQTYEALLYATKTIAAFGHRDVMLAVQQVQSISPAFAGSLMTLAVILQRRQAAMPTNEATPKIASENAPENVRLNTTRPAPSIDDLIAGIGAGRAETKGPAIPPIDWAGGATGGGKSSGPTPDPSRPITDVTTLLARSGGAGATPSNDRTASLLEPREETTEEMRARVGAIFADPAPEGAENEPSRPDNPDEEADTSTERKAV